MQILGFQDYANAINFPEGWVSVYTQAGTSISDTLRNPCDFIQNGLMRYPPGFTHGEIYFAELTLFDTLDLKKDFTWEFRFKNPISEGAFYPNDFYVYLFGLNKVTLQCTFMPDNSFLGSTYIAIGDAYIKAKNGFIIDMNYWRTYKFKFRNNVLYFYIDDALIIQIPYNGNICYPYYTGVCTKGSATVDWMKFYDENDNLYFSEDFDDCNALKPVPQCDARGPFQFVSAGNDFRLCEGDTLHLSANVVSDEAYDFYWTGPNGFKSNSLDTTILNSKINQSGLYIINVSDKFGCSSRTDTMNVIISPKPSVQIRTDYSYKPCASDSAVLQIEPYDASLNYMWNTGETSRSIVVRKSGLYWATVTGQNGCTVNSDTLLIAFDIGKYTIGTPLSNGFYAFDTTGFKELRCDSIPITNSGDNTLLIDNFLLKRNISFTIPQSQFPFIIPANSTKNLCVCYAPDSLGFDTDTLYLEDSCKSFKLPLIAWGKKNDYTGSGKCRFGLDFSTSNRYIKKQFRALFPFPNPANDELIIPFVYSSDNQDKKEKSVVIELLNIFGISNYKNTFLITDFTEFCTDKNIIGKIPLNLLNIKQGVYILVIRHCSEIESFSVSIQK